MTVILVIKQHHSYPAKKNPNPYIQPDNKTRKAILIQNQKLQIP